MIDSRKLARIRRRVVGGYLHGLGYEPSTREYLAKVGPQLRYVSFGRGYSKNFDVSIALHFDFLPPFAFAVWPGAPVPAEMCSELCAFQRLVRSRSGSQYYEYGETEAAAAEMLGDIAVRVAAGLDEIGSTCGDGRRLIELISPKRLADDLDVFRSLLLAPQSRNNLVSRIACRFGSCCRNGTPTLRPQPSFSAIWPATTVAVTSSRDTLRSPKTLGSSGDTCLTSRTYAGAITEREQAG